ncbi:MAG: restriction endonuclease subunit S, partial [bacterium]|nr:restriction endonuclease subunit S [bacterium]
MPEHWESCHLSFLLKRGLSNGIFKKKTDYGTGVRLINVFDVYRDDFRIDEDSLDRVQVDESELRTYSAGAGDIFFVRSSLKAEGVGKCACHDRISEPTVFECHLVRGRPDESKIASRFLIYFL